MPVASPSRAVVPLTAEQQADQRRLEHLGKLLGAVYHLIVLPTPNERDAHRALAMPLSPTFTSLRVLDIHEPQLLRIRGLQVVRPVLKILTVRVALPDLGTLLSGCLGDHCGPASWSQLRQLQCHNTNLEAIDQSVGLLSMVEDLNLSHNRLTMIENLERCSTLTSLNLAFNRLQSLPNVNRVLGNVTTLILRNNIIFTTSGLERLYALETLDLSHNLLGSLKEVEALASLPCLTNLLLGGNPISFVSKYRQAVLLLFREKMATSDEFVLDDTAVSDKERVKVLEKVSTGDFQWIFGFGGTSMKPFTSLSSPLSPAAATIDSAEDLLQRLAGATPGRVASISGVATASTGATATSGQQVDPASFHTTPTSVR